VLQLSFSAFQESVLLKFSDVLAHSSLVLFH